MKEIGEMLRQTRREKGLSLKDVQSETKIRQKYLEALENGDFELIPGEVYLKGFLRCYANALGLDGMEVVERYKALKVKEARPKEAGEEVLVRAPLPALPADPAGRRRRRWAPLVAGLLLMAALVIGGLYVFGIRSRVAVEPSPATPTTSSPAPGEPSPDTPAAGSPGPVEPSSTARSIKVDRAETSPYQTDFTVQGVDRIYVLGRFTNRCWVQVTADGKTIFEGTPAVGEELTWEAAGELVIWAGYPPGLDLTLLEKREGDGRLPLGKAGEPLNPKHLYFRLRKP